MGLRAHVMQCFGYVACKKTDKDRQSVSGVSAHRGLLGTMLGLLPGLMQLFGGQG